MSMIKNENQRFPMRAARMISRVHRVAVTVLLTLIMVMGVTGCARSEAVVNAEGMIDAIGNVTLNSGSAIRDAENAFSALSDEDKEDVKNTETLDAAKATLEALEAAEAVRIVEDAIAAIGEVTLNSAPLIDAARQAYDAASAEIKAGVTRYDALTDAEQAYADLLEAERLALVVENAEKAKAAIAAIGEVTLDAQERVNTASEAYSALTDEEKTYVDNAAVLEAAQEKLDTLIQERKAEVIKQYEGNFDLDYDKVQDTTWYYHKDTPEYINTRSYMLPYLGVSSSGVWMVIRYNYTGDNWVFYETLTILVDGVRYYKYLDYNDPVRDNAHGDVWEYYDECLDYYLSMDADEIQMLQAIAASEETIIRFEGDEHYFDLTVKSGDKQIIAETLALYEAMLK